MASTTKLKQHDTWPPLFLLLAEGPLAITGQSGADTITCPGHGFSNGDIVIFPEITGGTPLVAVAALYYVVNKTADTFKVSATSGGSAIDIAADITAGKVKRLLPVASATARKLLLKSAAHVITGTGVAAIDPPEVHGGQVFNAKYTWVAGDTDFAGDYTGEVELTWAAGQVETVPNDDGQNILVSIVADLG